MDHTAVALIEWLDGHGQVLRSSPVYGWPCVLGRAVQADVHLDDPCTAAEHAVLSLDGQGVRLTVGDTVNGVLLGERHLSRGESAVMAAGQTCRLGHLRLRVRLPHEALAPERIIGVETGGCPHTAIREDASINLEAVDQLNRRFPGLDLIIVESGGDNLSATFSPELSDLTIYVIDVSAGDKLPRKGGPGICKSDLLVINKVDLAPLVGASLEVMERDTLKMRGDKPFVFSNQKIGQGLDQIIAFIEQHGMLNAA